MKNNYVRTGYESEIKYAGLEVHDYWNFHRTMDGNGFVGYDPRSKVLKYLE